MSDRVEEFIVILSTKAIFWLDECPLPIWSDPDGGVHYLHDIMADGGQGKRVMVFVERPMPEVHKT